MKTWTVTRNTFERPQEHLEVRSFGDPDQARAEILAELGYEVAPCCESDGDPCEDCAREAAEREADRAEDAAERRSEAQLDRARAEADERSEWGER